MYSGESAAVKKVPRQLQKSDIAAVAVLVLSVAILLLPALAGLRGIFQDDQAMDVYPWHYFISRHFQNGTIPLWRAHTWAGAVPFYARYYSDTYYFALWPFFLLAPLRNLDRAYLVLTLAPLFLHYALGAVGMYVFARRSMKARPPGSFIAAWVYIFSPAMMYSYVWFPIVAVQAWLPWFLNSVAAIDRGRFWKNALWAAVFIALMALAASPPHLGYILALAALMAGGLGLRRWLRKEGSRAWRPLAGLLAAGVISVPLAAVYWTSSLEGSFHAEQHIDFTYEAVTGEDGSLPPPYLITLLAPDLFGTVTGRRVWGADISYQARYWEANTSGGMLLIFLALAAVIPLGGRRFGNLRYRFWTYYALGAWIFAILCALGRHTPFYSLFFRAVPLLSLFPYPIRYRLVSCVAVALLAGIGTDNLLRWSRANSFWPKTRVWVYLAVATVLTALALLWPQDLTDFRLGRLEGLSSPWVFPGVREVFLRGWGDWFLLGPATYLLGAAVVLVLATRFLRGRASGRVFPAAVVAEAAIFGALCLYFSTFGRYDRLPEHERHLRPSSHPMIQRVLGPLASLRADPELRWASDQPFHDNFSQLDESWALMGYDMKPLESRFKEAIEEAYGMEMDWPIYWHHPHPRHPGFLTNMSVGYLMTTKPENPFGGTETVRIDRSPDLYVHTNPRPLPRAFTLDRLVLAGSEPSLRALVGGDLRAGVFIEEIDETIPPAAVILLEEYLAELGYEAEEAVTDDDDGESPERVDETDWWDYYFREGRDEAAREAFERLQAANRIVRLDLSHPNRVEVEVDVATPAMLVLTETWYPYWRVEIDGEPSVIHRVNYCQRGVWLDEGMRAVRFSFHPPLWRIGGIVSLVSWGLLIVGVLFHRFRQRTREKGSI